MRIAALILGILGGLSSAFFGFLFYVGTSPEAPEIKLTLTMASAASQVATGEEQKKLEGAFLRLNRTRQAGFFLLGGILMGVGGGVLSFLRFGQAGSVLMLGAVIGPCILGFLSGAVGIGLMVFGATSLLLIGGVLSLFVKPAEPGEERPPPRDRSHRKPEDDEDEPAQKRRRRRQ